MAINMNNSDTPKGWKVCALPDFTRIVMGQSPSSETYNHNGQGMPFFQGKAEFGEIFPRIDKYCSEPNKIAKVGATLLSVRAPVGPVNLATQRLCIGRGLAAIMPAPSRLITPYAFYFLRSQEEHIKGDPGATFPSINKGDIEKLQIPLPPLEVQREIVAEIEGYQKVIDGAHEEIETLEKKIQATLARVWGEDPTVSQSANEEN